MPTSPRSPTPLEKAVDAMTRFEKEALLGDDPFLHSPSDDNDEFGKLSGFICDDDAF